MLVNGRERESDREEKGGRGRLARAKRAMGAPNIIPGGRRITLRWWLRRLSLLQWSLMVVGVEPF